MCLSAGRYSNIGLSKLNVWATVTENPCKLNERTIWVSVFTCEGHPLVWGGRTYELLPGPNGHLEVDVPPGIYYVRASYNGCTNGYTDAAVVRIGCGETVCVTLMVPSIARCIHMLNFALRQPIAREMIGDDLLEPAQNALSMIESRLPRPIRAFELEKVHLEKTAKLLIAPERVEGAEKK
jgi:hypothetical protein